MLNRRTFVIFGQLLFITTSAAQAHFLWIVSKPDDRNPSAKVYFSESASPDDPELLERVLKAEAWALGGGRGNEPQPLELVKEGDALTAALSPEQRQSPVVLRHTYGVLSRGGESFLLKYYAKNYPTALPGTWRGAKNAELLPLEVVPALSGSDVVLEVLWQGRAQAGATVTVEGPGMEKKLEGTTDANGRFQCRLPESGMYSIRARHTEAEKGELDGKAYDSVRHYSTLALRYLPVQLKTAASDWPALPRGVTSFGAAIDGDTLYVYGGHYGKAHEYDREEQSSDFYRLDLKNAGTWEPLPGGPKLTGLALVAHGGKLYRIGGFTARNAEGSPQDLWSQADFARFDPKAGQWETLPALPEGRSSFDAAVIGNVVYVVGGWEMQGDQPTRWLNTALAFDLAAESPQWSAIAAPPFHRRAVALAAWNNRLYCVGGMREKGGPTTEVAVFDPATNKWSEGPALVGSGMDGFGSSAFACGGRLFATTMSGSVQRLAASGDHWEFVGQLDHPRFFHRLLAWKNDRLVVVGGASMAKGKIQPLELLPVKSVPAAAR